MLEPYAYFVGLSPNNLPQPKNAAPSHDIVSWYLQWPGRDRSIRSVRHGITDITEFDIQNIGVRPQKNPLPSLNDITEILGFLRWTAGATLLTVLDLLRGRWWHAVLLGEAALSAQARAIPSSLMGKSYLFHNSSWIYRPLWTYEAERIGAEVTLYFYSTNCEPFKRSNGYPVPYYGYKAMNWSQYWVWDDHQADFICRVATGNPQTLVVGPIWFSGTADQLPGTERAVAVFDVTPLRTTRYCSLGLDIEFYTPATTNKFLKDISNAALKHGGRLLWKRKRNTGRAAHPHYRYFVEQLDKEPHVSLIDPDVSAIKVIEASTVAISMPFTSTAILARALGKPSVYYDPTGKLQADDRAAHGIPVLCSQNALEEWLASHL
jgi:polysaccharide biosynthesis PFTS motif protein